MKNEDTSIPPRRAGLARVWHAGKYSLDGLRAGWAEPAFRQELMLAALLLPLVPWVGQTWAERVLLAAVVVAVLVVELLNSGIEAAIDRQGPQWHVLSKQAKDMGSAAVLLSLLLSLGVWVSALWRWLAG